MLAKEFIAKVKPDTRFFVRDRGFTVRQVVHFDLEENPDYFKYFLENGWVIRLLNLSRFLLLVQILLARYWVSQR